MPYKLLLADDSVTIQRVIELTFADEDVQVIAVGDGQKAIDRMETERPDIVLADVGMPERDGYDVATFVKSHPSLSHVPVLLLTGAFEPVDEARARAIGCEGVLVKPFEPQVLINRVRDLLAGRSPVAMWPPGMAKPEPPPAPAPPPSLPAVRSPTPEAWRPPADTAAAYDQAPDRRPLGEGTIPGSIEDYLDQLDASFPAVPGTEPAEGGGEEFAINASDFDLKEPQRPSAPPAGAPLDDDWHAIVGAEAPRAAGLRGRQLRTPQPVGHEWVAPPAGAPATPEPLRPAKPAGRGAPRAEPSDRSMPSAGAAARTRDVPAPRGGPVGPPDAPALADAFTALLAAEQGQDAAANDGRSLAARLATDDLVEAVARRLLERMSDKFVRQTVGDIVTQVAERLVREEIDRIKKAAG